MDMQVVLPILAGFLNILILAVTLVILNRRTGYLNDFSKRFQQLENYCIQLEKNQQKTEQAIREEIARNREEVSVNFSHAREELSNSLKNFGDSFFVRMSEIAVLQKNQLDIFTRQLSELTGTNEQRLENMRKTVEEKLKHLQEDNSQKLELMRATVDEKLHNTLERRLGESFKLVSERLEQVHKGLGEMQVLASGVGDLKKILTNVKTRGICGEIHLGNILEQLLTPDQYYTNVVTKEASGERVEFAVRLPGRGDDGSEVLLPIDAKFPQEDYQRYIDACEEANPVLAEEAAKQLENRIKTEARRICDKYINPPYTTDFAVMFLPTESLYADVLKRPGLIEYLQANYRISITGPTTTAALLNSLSMGFKTLAIQKRSGEIWMLLGAVKTEFGKFGSILEKTYKKLQEASSTVDEAARRSRAIERKLKNIEELPTEQAKEMLGEIAGSEEEEY